MRSVVAIALAVLLVAAVSASPSMSSYLERFQKFKVDFKRAYADEFEDAKRFGYFVANMKKAAELEKTNPYATFGENEFADYSAAELKAHHCYRPTSAAERNESAWFSDEQVKARATSIDWRARGAVTSVKDQGNCGSCFAFAATANIESSWAIAGNPLIDLSEQMVVSCDTTDGGCNGGVESSVYTWLLKSQGGKLVSLASYPYTGKKAACSIPANAASATITSWLSVPKNEAQMATQVANVGPVSIGIDSTALDAYKSGVLTNCQNKALDHSVIIIGFDDGSVPPYWIIKNSWGPSFGENGYFRVAMNTNQCGLTSDPTATLAKSVGPAPGPVPPTPPGPAPPTPPGPTSRPPRPPAPPGPSPPTPPGPTSRPPRPPTPPGPSPPTPPGPTSRPPRPPRTTTGGPGPSPTTTDAPSPPTTQPTPQPTPPTPTETCPPAVPAGPTFTRFSCSEPGCASCAEQTFPQNMCVALSSCQSVMGACTDAGLTMTVYPFADDCTGDGESTVVPVGQCTAVGGTYVYASCGAAPTAAPGTA